MCVYIYRERERCIHIIIVLTYLYYNLLMLILIHLYYITPLQLLLQGTRRHSISSQNELHCELGRRGVADALRIRNTNKTKHNYITPPPSAPLRGRSLPAWPSFASFPPLPVTSGFSALACKCRLCFMSIICITTPGFPSGIIR